jgi:hypothetical protein
VTAITGAPASLSAAASQATVVVVTERECSWAATSSASWLAVSPAAGQGESTLTLTVAANGATSSRSATLVVNDARITLTQAAGTSQPPAPPAPSVSFSGSVSNLVGACPAVTFNVVANGTAPLAYRWNKNGVPVSGATSANYSIVVESLADAGSYSVAVSNAAGTVTSSAVRTPPTTPDLRT